MTKRGSYLALLSNADKARFKEEVEDKPSEVQSDLTVQFFADKLGIREKIVEVDFVESRHPFAYREYRFNDSQHKSANFNRHVCTCKQSVGCKATIMIPKTAQPGLRQALYTHSEHNHSALIDDYDEFGRSVHLIQLVEAVETLRKAKVDISDAFKKGLKQRWINKQNEEVKESAEYFNERRELFDEFDDHSSRRKRIRA